MDWSPASEICEDVHITLPLTIRFLGIIPSHYIHPIFHKTFGSYICERGVVKNERYTREVWDVAAQFPRIDHFPEDSLIVKMTKDIEDKRIRASTFVLALTTVKGRMALTKSEHGGLVAMRLVLKELPSIELIDQLYLIVLRLIKWEWDDWLVKNLLLLDVGFKFTKRQSHMIWLVLTLSNDEYKTKVIELLRDERGLYQTTNELVTRCEVAKVDVVTFTLLLRLLTFPSELEQKSWLQAFRLKVNMTEEYFTTDEVIKYMLTKSSTFPHVDMEMLTVDQLTLQFDLKTVITPEEFCHDLI
jgi:hypothetical protein